MIPLTPKSSPFPYTTLFRSRRSQKPIASPPHHPRHHAAHAGHHRLELAHLFHHLLHLGKLVHHRVQLGHGHAPAKSEEHTSELQSQFDLLCRPPPDKKTPFT